ncbi:hypothetical protein AB0D32_26345 [Micromonospora sp. NPDC048170]
MAVRAHAADKDRFAGTIRAHTAGRGRVAVAVGLTDDGHRR